MSLLSWWTNTFSTMPRMFTGGLGKNSNQCWHQFTDRTNKTEKRKKYNWNVKASDILDKFSTNFRLSNAKILVKLSFDKLWTCLKRLYNLIIIIFFLLNSAFSRAYTFLLALTSDWFTELFTFAVTGQKRLRSNYYSSLTMSCTTVGTKRVQIRVVKIRSGCLKAN